jgi:putative DNA primase/helicase
MGNAERLLEEHSHELRHVDAWGWLYYDGRRWIVSDKIVHELAKQVVRRIYREGAAEKDSDIRRALAKWAISSEGKGRVGAMVDLAKTAAEVRAEVSDFDSDPFLFNVSNGTLDLRSGTLLEHRPSDLITKLAPVVFEPEAHSDLWSNFLAEVAEGKEGYADFLQRLSGYCLTGDTREEILPIAHGEAGRGKSTFLEALAGTLGTYAGGVRIEALTDSGRAGGHNEDIARLVGLRLVTAVEASEGSRLREGTVKHLTGGDTIPASRKNKPGFEFRPNFKLWMATNEVPRMRADDSGMQRRVVKLPFTNAPRQPDKRLKEKLRSGEARSAILGWAVEGCLAWQQHGLNPPECVRLATEELWTDMDQIGAFFDERCIFGDEHRCTARLLRTTYTDWCEEQGIAARYQVSQRRMADWLYRRHCDRRRIGGHYHWLGVGIGDLGDHYSESGFADTPTGFVANGGPNGPSSPPPPNSNGPVEFKTNGDPGDEGPSTATNPAGEDLTGNSPQWSPRSPCPACGTSLIPLSGGFWCPVCTKYMEEKA